MSRNQIIYTSIKTKIIQFHFKKNSMEEKQESPEKINHFKKVDDYIEYDFYNTLVFLKKYARANFDSDFKFHRTDIEILRKLFIYFIHDKETCEKEGLDLKKGILLIGPVGCGKTSLMRVFNFLTHDFKKFITRPCREITTEFIQDGFVVLNKYGKANKIYCLDDLGVELSFKKYGNECNVIAEVLLSRYDFMKANGKITHATTNLNADELEKMYGNRVRSRLREMFNLITFPSNTIDKRK